jgi:hypothetical protein
MTTLKNTSSPRRSAFLDGRRAITVALFLLLTLGSVLLSSQLALNTIDRSRISEGIVARQLADYSAGSPLEINPLDLEEMVDQVSRDDLSLQMTGAGLTDLRVDIALLPGIPPSLPAVTPTATPTPIPLTATPISRLTVPAGTPSAVEPPNRPGDDEPPASAPTDAPPATRPLPPSATPPPPSATIPATPTLPPTETPLASPTPTIQPTASPTFVPSPSPTATSAPADPSDPFTPTPTPSPTAIIPPGNQPPDTGDDAVTVNEDGSVNIDVLLNDPDPDGDALDVATLQVTGSPANGDATVAGSQIIYTPDTNYFGGDTFTYRVCDVLGACNTARVTVVVNSAPDPPQAVSDSATTNEDNAVPVSVLANDTDPDGDLLNIGVFGQGASGAVTRNGNQLTYTPGLNFFGQDVFTYTVTDGGTSATASVTVMVTPVNDAPVAVDDTAQTAEDTGEDIEVRLNDTDVDGDSLTVVAVGDPGAGTATTNGSTIYYTPPLNFDSSTTFTYTVSDGQLSDQAQVTVTMLPINDRPLAGADSYSTNMDTQLVVNAPGVLSNDSDPEGSQLTAFVVTGPARGTLVLNSDGAFTYTPDTGLSGPDSFTYRASDGTAYSTLTTVSITVNN